jgi:hypothetical protein
MTNIFLTLFLLTIAIKRTLELIVPYEHLLRLANGKKVKMTLGTFEFNLSKDHLEAIRDLASRTLP